MINPSILNWSREVYKASGEASFNEVVHWLIERRGRERFHAQTKQQKKYRTLRMGLRLFIVPDKARVPT